MKKKYISYKAGIFSPIHGISVFWQILELALRQGILKIQTYPVYLMLLNHMVIDISYHSQQANESGF